MATGFIVANVTVQMMIVNIIIELWRISKMISISFVYSHKHIQASVQQDIVQETDSKPRQHVAGRATVDRYYIIHIYFTY